MRISSPTLTPGLTRACSSLAEPNLIRFGSQRMRAHILRGRPTRPTARLLPALRATGRRGAATDTGQPRTRVIQESAR